MNENETRRGKRKLRVLLTPSEHQKLEEAAFDACATKSLLVYEAVREGLAGDGQRITQERRERTIDVWVPPGIKERLEQLASNLTVTQQHLTRHLLFTYLSATPWRTMTEPARHATQHKRRHPR